MASPSVEVRDGVGSYTSVVDGKDVTPAATVTIRLVSSAGVGPWLIECISTDELSDKDAINASLVVDTANYTATFTAPASARALRFRSKVNNGLTQGRADASLSTTFGIYTLTAGGRRVHAVDETFESDSVFGWVGDLNDLIRNPAAGGSTPTGTGLRKVAAGVEDAAASLLVNADVNASAAIALSKLAAGGSNGNVVRQAAGVLSLGTIDLASAACVGATILPAANGGTGLSALGTGIATFLGTPSSANLSAAITDETGSASGGLLVFNNSPRLFTPRFRDSGNDHDYIWATLNIAADRTITLPLLTGNDTFVFEAHTQTLTNKTLTSPVLGGTPVFSATSVQATGNARTRAYSDISNVQTTDATVTTLFSWTILDEAVTKVVSEAGACQSTGANTAAYTRQIRFKRDAGTVSAGTIDAPFTSEDVAGWDHTIDNSTSTGRTRVTGAAATTIDWGGLTNRLEVNHA